LSRVLSPPRPIKRYIRKVYVLDSSLYPNRIIDEFLFQNRIDGIYVDFKNSTANLANIEISIDEGDWLPAALLISGVEAYGNYFWRLRIRWLSSEDNKQIVLILCGEQSLKLVIPLQSIDIVKDDVGLAKDSTLQLLTRSLRSVGGDSILVSVYSRHKSGFILFSGTVTNNGNTDDIDVSIYSALEILLKVTGVGGTNPTLSVYIEGKFEATGDYKHLVFQEVITTTGVWYFTITQLIFRYIRVRWVVGGVSPSFTFTVVAQAMV
jgi:hypothetical protein